MDESINSKLLKAIELGNITKVKYYLDNGANPNLYTENGNTILSLACNYNFKRSIIPMLIDAGANVNSSSANGLTALHTSAEHGLIDSTVFLLKANANPNAVTNNGDTPLILAAKNGSTYLVELFCNYNININHQNKYKRTALIEAILHDRITTAFTLIKFNCDINICDIFERSAIMYAAYLEHDNLVKYILEHSAYDHRLIYAIKTNEHIAHNVKSTLFNLAKCSQCYFHILPKDIIRLIYPLITGINLY